MFFTYVSFIHMYMVPFIGATFNIQQHMAKNVHAPLYLCTFHHIMEIDRRAERTQSFFMKANTFIFSTNHMLKLSNQNASD